MTITEIIVVCCTLFLLMGVSTLLFMFYIFQEINRKKFKAKCNAEQYSLIRKYENIPFWRIDK